MFKLMRFAAMTLPPPPRQVRLTISGLLTYVFLITLATAMMLGPPVSFLLQRSDKQTLLERGVLTRFDMTASRPTRGGQQIDYVFQAREATGSVHMQLSRQSTISNEDFASFTDPEKRFVLYDPADPENALPVTSRSALAHRLDIDRKVAILVYLCLAAIIILFLTLGVHAFKRKLRLLRFGTATSPAMTRYAKGRLGWPCVEFQFTDTGGKLRQGRRCFNVRVSRDEDFAPFMTQAVVFFDQEDPRICELFLPRLAAFRFVES